MLHRTFSLPLSQAEIKTELSTIQNIAKNNGFPTEAIKNLINKKEKQLLNTSLTYCEPLSIKISNILTTHNINVAFKSQRNLSNLFYNAKDKTSKFEKSGVYKLNCSECNSIYIGQTGRNFKTRYLDHNRSFRLQKRIIPFLVIY